MTRAERRAEHRALAGWLRGHGIQPAGAAWDAAKAGQRDIVTLRRLNGQDGTPAKRTPDGRRLAAGLRDGDYLTGCGVIVGDPIADPERGTLWVTVRREDGSTVDRELTPSDPVAVVRPRVAPAWIREAAAEYRAARDAWESWRESGRPAPASVPGSAGAAVSMSQLEDSDFAAACPRPVYRDFVRAAAERLRENA